MRSQNSPKADLPATSGAPLPLVSELLEALTPKQHELLLRSAERSLRRFATTPWRQRLFAIIPPEDIVADALHKLLSGERNPQEGRVLPPNHRRNVEAFLIGLKGVINSEISNLASWAEGAIPHHSLEKQSPEGGAVELPDPVDSPGALARRDLQCALFDCLRSRAQEEPELLPVIDAWEHRFLEADRIAGSEFDQNLVYRVRQHARRILWELAKEAEPQALDGREMLL